MCQSAECHHTQCRFTNQELPAQIPIALGAVRAGVSLLPWYTNTAVSVLIFCPEVLNRTEKETQAAMLLSEHLSRAGLGRVTGYFEFTDYSCYCGSQVP